MRWLSGGVYRIVLVISKEKETSCKHSTTVSSLQRDEHLYVSHRRSKFLKIHAHLLELLNGRNGVRVTFWAEDIFQECRSPTSVANI